MNISKWLWAGFLLEIFVVWAAWQESDGATTAFFQSAARLSGRVSLLFFGVFVVYAGRFPNVEAGSEHLKIKGRLAFDFMVVHVIHWFLLAAAVRLSGFELVPFRLAGGILAYGLVVAMPFILRGQIRLPWSVALTQHLYVFYVWLIFFMTYLTRIQGKTPTATGSMSFYYFGMGACIALLSFYLFPIRIPNKR